MTLQIQRWRQVQGLAPERQLLSCLGELRGGRLWGAEQRGGGVVRRRCGEGSIQVWGLRRHGRRLRLHGLGEDVWVATSSELSGHGLSGLCFPP